MNFPEPSHVARIVDFERSAIDKNVLAYIESIPQTYTDLKCGEHLFDIEDIVNGAEEALPHVKTAIEQLEKLMEENDSIYFRIVMN